jgi:hypothetical protein
MVTTLITLWANPLTYGNQFSTKIRTMQQHNNDAIKQLMIELGKIIKKHRVAQRKTIYNISAECSLSKATWRAVEIGYSRNIQLTTLWKIAEGLDLEPATLLRELKEKLGKDFLLSDLT